MRSFLAEELLKFEGSHLLGNSFAVFKGMTYDSRTVEKGNLFVALKGENVDGNDFVEKAFENGASVVLCSRKVKPPEGKAIVYAENPEKIIGEFASCLRSKFRGSVIGIVGSAGKTTTKDFCAKFLSELDLTYFSQGNKNNLLGVPQTIVNADFEAKYWVLEMGISFTNEMDLLANIVKPNIVIFTSIKPVHLEFLHSLENIFAEKSNVLKHLCEPSFFIYNKDDEFLKRLPDMFNTENFSYGYSPESDLKIAVVEELGIEGFIVEFKFKNASSSLKLPFLNEANIYNFAASFLLSYILSGDVSLGEKVLSKITPSAHRGKIYKLKNGAFLYDDSYNSNPEAAKILLKSSANWGREIIGVLGEMRELGENSPKYHSEVGEFASGILSSLICIGNSGAKAMLETFKKSNKPCHHFSNWKESKDFLKSMMNSNSVVLVKGSRAVALDQLVDCLISEIGVEE